jgi:hypothetical protein
MMATTQEDEDHSDCTWGNSESGHAVSEYAVLLTAVTLAVVGFIAVLVLLLLFVADPIDQVLSEPTPQTQSQVTPSPTLEPTDEFEGEVKNQPHRWTPFEETVLGVVGLLLLLVGFWWMLGLVLKPPNK